MCPGPGQAPLVNNVHVLLEGPGKSQARAGQRECEWRGLRVYTRMWAQGRCREMAIGPACLLLHTPSQPTPPHSVPAPVECTHVPTQKHFTDHHQMYKTESKP